MRRLAPPVLALVLLALATPAHAHKNLGARKVMATARLDGEALALDVMVWMRIAGPRARALAARYDLDRSGALEPAEAALAGDALAPEAIGGFYLRRAGVAQPPRSAEARARITDGGVEVAVLLGWSLGALGDGAPIELASRAGRDRPNAPTLVAELAALPPLALTREAGPLDGGVARGPLVPGRTTLAARVTRSDDP